MDYKVTFTDGSEALAHHGTKGMKWGVWNEETAARYGHKGDKRGFTPTQKALLAAAGTTAAAVAVAQGARVVGTMLGGPVAGVAAGRGASMATRMFSQALTSKYDIPSLYEVSLNNDTIASGVNALQQLSIVPSEGHLEWLANLSSVDRGHE